MGPPGAGCEQTDVNEKGIVPDAQLTQNRPSKPKWSLSVPRSCGKPIEVTAVAMTAVTKSVTRSKLESFRKSFETVCKRGMHVECVCVLVRGILA